MQALGNHLSDILSDEMADMSIIVEQVKEESRRKELRSNDDKEDYLDEGIAHLLTFYVLLLFVSFMFHCGFASGRVAYANSAFWCCRKEVS